MVITFETAMLCVAVATLVVLTMKHDDQKRNQLT